MKFILRLVVTVDAGDAGTHTMIFDRGFSVNCLPRQGESIVLIPEGRAKGKYSPGTKIVARVGHETVGRTLCPIVVVEHLWKSLGGVLACGAHLKSLFYDHGFELIHGEPEMQPIEFEGFK